MMMKRCREEKEVQFGNDNEEKGDGRRDMMVVLDMMRDVISKEDAFSLGDRRTFWSDDDEKLTESKGVRNDRKTI